jgi:Domain of unknown function (DUF4062)
MHMDSHIRTPDQRLRVFVSSTLQELAPERAAARRAINSLRLSPVLFELGARPHPPRALYRAYLAQSDVFVGIYWQSYGWVAPGEAVSGLEDEYDLAGQRPKLIYVKARAPEREARPIRRLCHLTALSQSKTSDRRTRSLNVAMDSGPQPRLSARLPSAACGSGGCRLTCTLAQAQVEGGYPSDVSKLIRSQGRSGSRKWP